VQALLGQASQERITLAVANPFDWTVA